MPFERVVIDQSRPLSKWKPWDQWAYDFYFGAPQDECISIGCEPITLAATRRYQERLLWMRMPELSEEEIREVVDEGRKASRQTPSQ